MFFFFKLWHDTAHRILQENIRTRGLERQGDRAAACTNSPAEIPIISQLLNPKEHPVEGRGGLGWLFFFNFIFLQALAAEEHHEDELLHVLHALHPRWPSASRWQVAVPCRWDNPAPA